MLRVVIESPLKGNFERNRRYALWCAYHCRTLGEAAYASHLFYTQFLDDRIPEERAFGIAAGLAWAEAGDVRAFYTDLGWSDGMTKAKEKMPPESMFAERTLPPEMFERFAAGEYPAVTPGF